MPGPNEETRRLFSDRLLDIAAGLREQADIARAAAKDETVDREALGESIGKNLRGLLDDIRRTSFNMLYTQGGVELVREEELRMKTCGQCGYVSESESGLIDCPICGWNRIKSNLELDQ